MSSNDSIEINSISIKSYIVAYYALFLVTGGTLLNSLTFIILCRSTFRNKTTKPTSYYMRTIAVFDTLMLYGWNLDYYMSIVHGYYLQTSSIGACKFLSFFNYFTSQSSAWFRVFVCLDRYLAMSRLYRTWFNHSKHVLIIISSIIGIFLLLNFHFFIFACFYNTNGQISINSSLYHIYPYWDYINLGVCNCIPFILMITFNSGTIYHLIHRHRTTMIQNSRIHHRSISITLVITTFLFLIMTVPATIAYAFFYTANTTLLGSLNCFLYSYHIISCPLYFITYGKFRRECIAMITCKKHQQKITPLFLIPLHQRVEIK